MEKWELRITMNVSLVIPAFNEAERLPAVLSKCIAVIPSDRIYLVDDGSTDGTPQIAIQHNVILLQHAENRGKGEALKTGFQKALSDGCEAVITLDGDGQHNPDDIPRLMACCEKERCDIVLGTRQFRPGHMPLIRLLSNRISSSLVSLWAGKKIIDSQCGYRLIRRDVLSSVKLATSTYVTESELLIKAVRQGFNVTGCPIALKYDNSGSNMSPVEIFRFAGLLLKLLMKKQVL